MKTLIKLLAVCFLLPLSAQDTLNCKDDLIWDKDGKYYYRKNDETKTGVTSPAKCFPCKTCINKGNLKNGRWNGMVYGYKDGNLIGRLFYADNAERGYIIKFNLNGALIDSTVFDKNGYTYNLTKGFNKNNELDYISEYCYKNDTSVVRYYAHDANVGEYVQLVRRFKGKKKHGIQEHYDTEFLNNKPKIFLIETEEYNLGKLSGKVTQYEEGLKSTEYEYTDGVKTKEIWFDLSGNIEIVYSYKDGKRHGTATHYNLDGSIEFTEEYKNNKLVK
ncbi:MAG: toxin-antitoxin system YwqK family antitoxin [Flavobacteriales bacterium]